MVRLPVSTPQVSTPEYISARALGITPLRLGSPQPDKQPSQPPIKKPIKKFSKACLAGLALTLGLVVTSCGTPQRAADEPSPAPVPEASAPPKQVETPSATDTAKEPVVGAQPDGQAVPDKEPDAAAEMVTVLVYTIDDQCNDFVEQSVQVPSDVAITDAVGKAMGAVDYNAFKVESYQVDINGGTATVDMALAPGSERQFASLSSCEQRALFGSVEETLLNNPDWNVTAVKFTNQGKEIVL
jgi:hypothetical protein